MVTDRTRPGPGARTPAVLVVADPSDGGARAACRLAPAAGDGDRPLLVSTDALARAGWEHRVHADGRSSTTVRPARSGAGPEVVIDSDRLRLVWFRGRHWRLPVGPADADYAWSEFGALLVSWLAGLGDRVVNRPDGQRPSGPSWSAARWRAAAAEASWPVAPRTAATSARLVPGWRGGPWQARLPHDDLLDDRPTSVRLLLVDGVPVGSPSWPGRTAAGRRLAALSGCRVLGLDLDARGRVLGADPVPPLTGRSELAAVAALLGSTRPGAGERAA
ncbi:hypothetical protein FHX74_000011 [Friedmanniella endophytica]|uniref:Uncharacterized protein n=1 Tax=Microlunatus kandeliicorticis TaxID=1759536 RepID=A0A7W3P408_9ACTN|nr:hypothetical protein [Microlunatus kandeliicorticis]MBA8792417.1 hypothetical protein [Microlunatus kandeliicorticis]